ncbi:MAG: hypothetical protein COB02_15660 [Candidatus Cloacimonadota bacterium]|nr:MAG: hypothetical protein COB02_15660 [Candidatus Cloacimonadota bacterium]
MKSFPPPKVLYYGSNTRLAPQHLEQGLKPSKADFVILNQEKDPCIKLAKKTGKPLIFSVDSKSMQKDGYKFYIQKGGVWWVNEVPAQYLSKKK